MDAQTFAEHVRGQLIVSVQALPDEPLHGAEIMAKMAVAVQIGGAVGIRANGPEDIRAIKVKVDLPLIGLYKDGAEDVYITPTKNHARHIAEAGADVIALDCTLRPRPDGSTVAENIAWIHSELNKPVFADVSTVEEGVAAAAAGADFIGTTLSGYTAYSRQLNIPDFELMRNLVEHVNVPVFAEGRIHTPEQARTALDQGVWAVIVGSAITRPRTITQRFIEAIVPRDT